MQDGNLYPGDSKVRTHVLMTLAITQNVYNLDRLPISVGTYPRAAPLGDNDQFRS